MSLISVAISHTLKHTPKHVLTHPHSPFAPVCDNSVGAVSDGCAELAHIAVTFAGWGGSNFNPTAFITDISTGGSGSGSGSGPALSIEPAAVLAWMSEPHSTASTDPRIAMALSQVPPLPTPFHSTAT